ncbi:MAG: alanine racemase [Lachnospiraceae bacterium]|nr:alanine racemase [Lachnospiraceae bacterium]
MKKYSRVYAQVDLDAILYNLQQMKQHINENTQIMAVIKTDGYGHGAVPIAEKIQNIPYIWGFATATAEEALILRHHQITRPILVLGAVFEEQLEELIRNEVRISIFQIELAHKIQDIAHRLGRQAYIHIKLDTAMSRLGLRPEQEESMAAVQTIAAFPNLILEGIYTHFSKADERDKQTSHVQITKFQDFIERMETLGITFPLKHCANSAGIIDLKEYGFDMVRAGIALYGLYPSEDVQKEQVKLRPAMSLHSQIVCLKEVEAGVSVSYGGTYTTTGNTWIATVPVGYGDGYPRLLSNKGFVLVHGQKAPILGRICMDQFMIDVTAIPDVQEGDEVVLFGPSRESYLSVETLSRLSGRFHYEFVCDLGRRIPRVYVSGGKIIGTKDWFHE